MKTNEEFPSKITMGEKYGPAMEITDQTEADAYFEKCVRHSERLGRSRAEAIDIEKQSIGYMAGYYDQETRERVYRLFKTIHPIFGNTEPTAEEALRVGLDIVAGIKSN